MGIKKRAFTENGIAGHSENAHTINSRTIISNPEPQIYTLHDNTDGFIALLKKIKAETMQRHYKLPQIAAYLDEWTEKDCYVSMNTFFTPKRLVTNLREIRAAFVDIDCYNTEFTAEQIEMRLRADYFGREIPVPNMIIHSGRGLNLVWFLEPMSGLAVDRWGRLQKAIVDKLAEWGADKKATDAARVFRLAGSTNSKNNARVYAEVLHDYRYEFAEIVDDYFPEIKKAAVAPAPQKQPQKKRRANTSVKRLFNEYTLLKARMSDMEQLTNVRSGNMEGCREYALFLYRYWALMESGSKEKAKTAMLKLNQQFKGPLPDREALADTQSAERYFESVEPFKITNAKVIEWLNITKEEQQQLQTIISAAEKRRRNTEYQQNKRRAAGVQTMDEYNADRKAQKAENAAYLAELKVKYPNATQRELAAFMGVSPMTVNRLLKTL